ncbi:unnamed protein product (plasmid) [Mycetohabitans rhizoxinica HKI 454]|uniref:Uncharacterized protein n=1 Tax=Mycetohabitans rhizoxinica (strain DSM 19002 / CIP 109453 / HKI 454) TaxID=882378 RepID=E5AWB9_MYCRK|nr:unnamed protein product [Mycetohabitans rhizoxinica HKI 454]
MGVRKRRLSVRRRNTGCGVVHLHALAQGHSSAATSRIVCWHATGRCLRRLSSHLRNRTRSRSSVLGSREATDLRAARRSAECIQYRSARANRSTL